MTERSAAEMREACARHCEGEAENHGRRANDESSFPSDRNHYRLCAAIRRNCANEIRAIPLSAPAESPEHRGCPMPSSAPAEIATVRLWGERGSSLFVAGKFVVSWPLGRDHLSELAAEINAAMAGRDENKYGDVSDDDLASNILMDAANFFAATLAKADDRAWHHLLVYAPHSTRMHQDIANVYVTLSERDAEIERLKTKISAAEAALAAPAMLDEHERALASLNAGACPCFRCIRERGEIIVRHGSASCECGNKRCPHASDHRFECTNSNEPGQLGSEYR